VKMEVADCSSYFEYWGKANVQAHPSVDSAQYHLLVFHCLDVAAVGSALLSPHKKLTKDLAVFLDITPSQLQKIIVFALSLHDMGKFASAFQQLYTNDSHKDLFRPTPRKAYDGQLFRHDRMGLFFWKQLKAQSLAQICGIERLSTRDQSRFFDTLWVLMECVLGHHGKPIDLSEAHAIKPFTEPHNTDAVALFVSDICTLLDMQFPIDKFLSRSWRQRLEQVSWQLAGVAVLADWVGSDNTHFIYQTKPQHLHSYWKHANTRAAAALAAIDLDKVPSVRPFISVKHHYGFEPTPLQRWAELVAVDNSPQLFVLEDVTGSGKTEAALALTHRLMQAGAAEGFYFGLPTMATSNAMFGRVAQHYQQMLSADNKQPSIVLAHGAREMNDLFREAVLASGASDKNYDTHDATATAQCNQWLADSRKKALLAPVGVGTIDQALLAVLPRRHQSLRLFGLNRKVLIFDEVHAADEFMFELLESLLALHLHQGGSAILLTATLSQKQRSRLTAAWLRAGGLPPQVLTNTHFPLATRVSLTADQTVLEQSVNSRADVCRTVAVVFLTSIDACVEQVLNAVSRGKCVVWIRNSVDDAVAAYNQLCSQLECPDDCQLFHSRFVLQDRKRTEDRVLNTFGKLSTELQRTGKVLVATQVFQESLDADADIMISDICPIDDLIQRAGRLHRHTRDDRGAYTTGIIDARSAPVLWVHGPVWTEAPNSNWLSEGFRNTQYVYRSPGRLWLAMRELIKLGGISMPDKARQLIESVYGEQAYEQIPESLKYQENELIGAQLSKAAKAKSTLLQWQQYGYSARSAAAWYEDNTDISTRYSDIETQEVLLLRLSPTGHLTPWVGEGQFAVQLSQVKLSKHKYADKLSPIPEYLETALSTLKKRDHAVIFLQCWLPEQDANYGYDSAMGFYEKQRKEAQ